MGDCFASETKGLSCSEPNGSPDPNNPSVKALKAAHDSLSGEVGASGGALVKGSNRFMNYPLTPSFSVSGQHAESSQDIIDKMSADDGPPPE